MTVFERLRMPPLGGATEWLDSEGRLYQLAREHDAVRVRTLVITFLDPGAEAYSFTFG